MEYDVALEEIERSANNNHQKFHISFQHQQNNSVILDESIKTSTVATNTGMATSVPVALATATAAPTPTTQTPTISTFETTSFQPNKSVQYAISSSTAAKQQTTTITLTSKNPSISETRVPDPKSGSSISMEATTTAHINLIDDEEEKDPLALDSSSSEQQSQLQEYKTVKHTHSLRRHVPRIIVKPIVPEKKTTVNTAATVAAATITTTTTMINTAPSSSISPSSRGSSSRRIQQQQQAKAAAAAAAAAAIATSNSTTSSPTATATTAITQASTMREVLASIPGFSLKPRRRSSKKISTAAQIEQTKDGKIDLETPDSILASTNLRALLNKQTFSMLPPLYQYNLIQLLPSVDREAIEMERKHSSTTVPMEAIRLGSSSLNNEFFARACLEWRERLSEGEFTPENQVKLKTEAEREKNKLDPWKLKHFEPFWGEKAAKRACSSNSSISSNKSSIDSCNIAISSSSNSGNNCKNLAEQKLEFKLEPKGALTATIVKATATNSFNMLDNPRAQTEIQPMEKKSIIECRLDQSHRSAEVVEVKEDVTLFKQDLIMESVNKISGQQEQYVCDNNNEDDNGNSTHLQQRNRDELICDKQTEMYAKIDAIDQSCAVASNSDAHETPIKRDPPSVFDLLRMQGNVYDYEAQLQKRGTKRSLDNSISSNAFLSCGGTGFASDNKRQQDVADNEMITDNYVESKHMKIEITNENVPKQSKNCFVSRPVEATQSFQHQSSSTSTATIATTTTELDCEVAQMVVVDQPSCNVHVGPIQTASAFTQEIIENYVAVEQQLHLQFLQKQQQQQQKLTQQMPMEKELKTSSPSTTKLQYFAQIQPPTNQNFININSTCDSVKDAFSAANSKSASEQQQNHAIAIESPDGGEAVDIIEQNFADAENYVLQSGDVSTDSGDTVNVQDVATNVGASIIATKNSLTQGDFIFSNSLDHVIGSDDCDHLYENNKSILPTSISSVTTSSSSSSSSSSTSSSPTTSSAVTTSDMQEILSAANSLSNTLFQTPQQQQQQHQQQRQHQEIQHQHQQQHKLQQQQQQQQHGCDMIMNSGSSSSSNRHNEMFQHVQHDWNFGGLKLQQTIASNLNDRQNQTNTEHAHVVLQSADLQEDETINDLNEEEEAVDECLPPHGINNDLIGQQNIIINQPVEDEDDVEEVEEDEMDDNDAVRDIVDELQQQHRQLLQEQQQEQLQQQLHVQEHRVEHQQYPTEHVEYSNEMSESLSSDVLCDVPMSAAEMEVTSTVITNSNSNDDSSNELNLFSNNANISNQGINNLHQLPPQPTSAQQQRQILIDSNGQIIRNFLVQQQQLQQQQQQLLQHAQQLAAFQQTNQHHQPPVAVPQPQPQHHQAQQQQQQQQQLLQPQQHKSPTLSMQVIRRPYEGSTNGQQQIFQHAVAAASQAQQHQLDQSSQQQQQHQLQQFAALQQQQQRNFLTQTPNATSQPLTSNNLMPSQQIQLQAQQHIQQQQQQQPHHPHQQMPTFQTQTQPQLQQQQPKLLSKQLNIISMPRSSVSITAASAATPSAASGYSYSTSPAIGAALPAAVTPSINNAAAQQQQHAASTTTTNIRALPPTPIGGGGGGGGGGIPSTIAQQRLMVTKMPSGKGRKATNNKLPPGAVNLERSYQICQAVIQNSPNRESLKAQLRPPSAILGQQQSSGGSSPSSTSLSNTCSSASSSPSSSSVMVKNEDILASPTTLQSGIPPNVMGVGRPNVYKVIGPRMGFPRKKYVQRQPSPTMIRHVYAAPPGTVTLPTNTQQLSIIQQHQQQQHQLHHHHLQAPPPQHELQNGSGQYVLVHRANVGAADNQAPRASSAPPVPQNQHQFHGMNGIPITGRGRPASVDVDTSNTVHDIQQTIHGANPANIVRRNISSGNITYIDNYSAATTAALVDGSNYLVAAAAAAAAAAATTATQSVDAGCGENTPPTTDGNNCACSLNAMVICQQCGAFCHDDCISATRLCVSCVIR